MEYRREIDGLRALAVVPVILFHAGFQAFSGGFVGVDVFFVISGYLITSIILAEKQAGTFNLINFYERRARRILPALFVVMFACLPFAWLWLIPKDMVDFSKSLEQVPIFLSNVFFNKHSDYFDSVTELKPLLHTWSLAVEEQYYLFFPAFLIIAWRFGTRFIVGLLAAIFLISLFYAQYKVGVQPSAAFYLLPSRLWELLVGSFIAFYLASSFKRDLNDFASQVGSLLGLLLLVYAVFMLDRQTPFPGLYALIPTLGAALIILCATERMVVGRLLGSKVLVGIGLISYSAYLWHQPLFVFARHRSLYGPDKMLMAMLVVLTILLSYFSWKYVERPFRNKQLFSRKQIFAYGAVGSVMFVVIALLGISGKGFPGRMPASMDMAEIKMPKVTNGWCFYIIDSDSSLLLGANGAGCWLGSKTSARKGVLFGDSFAGQYEPFWDVAGRDANVGLNAITTNWCYPSVTEEFPGPLSSRASQQCLYNRKYLLDNFSRYDFVILGGHWGDVLSRNKLADVIDLIGLAASKSKFVVVMASPKQFDSDVMAIYKKSILYGAVFDISKVGTLRDRQAIEANRLLEDASKKYSNVIYVDRESIFSLDGKASDLMEGNIPFSLEGAHISIRGSKAAASNFIHSQKYDDFRKMLRN